MSLWHTSYLYLAACVAAAPAEGGGAQVDHAPVRAALTASSAIALHGTGRGDTEQRWCHAAVVGTGRATRVGREEWARAQLHILNAS